MAKCDPNQGKYMQFSFMIRGDSIPREVNKAIAEAKYNPSTIPMVDWGPSGIRCGINKLPKSFITDSDLAFSSKSVTMLSNSTSISEPFERINFQFDL